MKKIWRILKFEKKELKIWNFGKKYRKLKIGKILEIIWNLKNILQIGILEVWRKFGKNLKIREVFGNLEKKIGNSGSIWKFGKKLKNYWNLDKIWKFGESLEIQKKIGKKLEIWRPIWNSEKNWKFRGKIGNLKKNLKFGNNNRFNLSKLLPWYITKVCQLSIKNIDLNSMFLNVLV